jgi:radical SAM superfamily enzyme YgiQ (UPF0313 family)
MPSIYIINPAPDVPSYHTGEGYGRMDGRGWVQVADLTIATIAALVPPGWDIRITDEAITGVDFDAEVDFVAITGKISQRTRMYSIASEFQRRGRTVILGGSFATLNSEDARLHCDIFVTGELEELAPKLFADLAAGTWSTHYDGGQADVRLSPLPRWDLYPLDRAQTGAVQTSRGCPFNCEFCDVIQYQGRKQRFKSVEQVIAEIDRLYTAGCRRIFLVDDNFTVNRKRAHAILAAIADWNNAREDGQVKFSTQASVDVARDPDLLDASFAAGLTTMFVGIETLNPESLRETGKKQNLLMPLQAAMKTMVGHGIAVLAGVITGFDHDDPSIFEELFNGFQALPLPELTVGCLTAPRSTPLHDRLSREGRLTGEVWDGFAAGPFSTNIIPARMTREQLLEGTIWLSRVVYKPKNYMRRIKNFIDAFGESVPLRPTGENLIKAGGDAPLDSRTKANDRMVSFHETLRKIIKRGPDEAAMVSEISRMANEKPGVKPAISFYLNRYEQFRMFLDERPGEVRRVATLPFKTGDGVPDIRIPSVVFSSATINERATGIASQP